MQAYLLMYKVNNMHRKIKLCLPTQKQLNRIGKDWESAGRSSKLKDRNRIGTKKRDWDIPRENVYLTPIYTLQVATPLIKNLDV